MSRFRDCRYEATCRDYALNRCDGCNEWEWVINKPTQPTVDAVEVVRCKDCKYYWRNNPLETWVCLASPRDDAYCSEGERREEA